MNIGRNRWMRRPGAAALALSFFLMGLPYKHLQVKAEPQA